MDATVNCLSLRSNRLKEVTYSRMKSVCKFELIGKMADRNTKTVSVKTVFGIPDWYLMSEKGEESYSNTSARPETLKEPI